MPCRVPSPRRAPPVGNPPSRGPRRPGRVCRIAAAAGVALVLGGCAHDPGPTAQVEPAPVTDTGSATTTSAGPAPWQVPAEPPGREDLPADEAKTEQTPARTPHHPRDVRPGAAGAAVRDLQQNLGDLGYFVGAPDGSYGPQTTQAVLALQKAAGLARDGTFGPRTRRALADGLRPRARTTSGSAIEIDLGRQLVLVVLDGDLRYVLNTSTGSGRQYVSRGVTSVATTPRGRFSVERQIDGLRVSPLGELWRPKYFTGGYALHGSPSIPGFAASHGCARLSNAAINLLWSPDLAPIGRTVWVY